MSNPDRWTLNEKPTEHNKNIVAWYLSPAKTPLPYTREALERRQELRGDVPPEIMEAAQKHS